MVMLMRYLGAFLVLVTNPVSAFTPSIDRRGGLSIAGTRISHGQKMMMLAPEGWVNSCNAMLIATIDSDIANIPDNEFATVFAGGIVVMFGGLFSALAVGFIIDSKNLYANIVADSYAQGGDDSEFWKGLSDEEKKKTQELLKKLKESKEGGASQNDDRAEPVVTMAAAAELRPKPVHAKTTALEPEESENKAEKKQIGMFSDYGDD